MFPMRSKFRKKRKAAKPAPVRKILPWNQFQDNVFQDMATGHGNTVVIAGPGSGKTNTILEGMYHIPKQERILFTAFNSAATAQLAERVPDGVTAATHHALGFRTIRKHWGHVYNLGPFGSVDKKNDSLFAMANTIVGDNMNHERLRQMLVYAVDMSKITLADDHDQISDVIDNYGIDLCGVKEDTFVNHVWKMLDACKNSPRILNGRNVISFADMIWLPHIHGWQPEQYNHVLVDEGQDLSPARTALLLGSVRPGGRIFVVGDPKQSIYTFAGAREDSISWLTGVLEAKTLPLSVSYRCAKSIINLAKEVNPNIEAAPNAIEGSVNEFEAEDLYNQVSPGTAILSRANFPLVKSCMALLNMGVKANIQGRDVGERFLWRINCWQPDSVKDLVKDVRDWKTDVCERLAAKNSYSSVETISDEAACIEQFCEKADNLGDVKERISSFFKDDPVQIKLSSAHKAKGLEWDKVIMLDKTFHPERGGEEAHIWYVAVTRAKNQLGIAQGKLP